VQSITVARVDKAVQPLPETERTYACDTVLIAVGLDPVDEFFRSAREVGLRAFAAGDAEEIAEASAAIFSGKITGRKLARELGVDVPVPSDWESFGDMLKHHGGEPTEFVAPVIDAPVYPLLRCVQEIPCNPCTEACPHNLISMPGSILATPEFAGDCEGCGQCVIACPGLAISLVHNDYDPTGEKALLTLPFEFADEVIPFGAEVITTDMEGNEVGTGTVIAVRKRADQDRRKLLMVEVPGADKHVVAGFRIREPWQGEPVYGEAPEADPMVCRCERVKKSEIVAAIRAGVRDMNQLKAVARSGMGGCGGKTCTELVMRLYREEGVDPSEVTQPTIRPLVAEVHLGDFVTGSVRKLKKEGD
jgi:sarcosine oxidase subunit alpha